MKQSVIRIFREFLITQLNNLIFYPLALTVATAGTTFLYMERPRMFVWLSGGIITFGLYIVRKHIHHFFLFLLMHFVAIAIWFGVSFLLASTPNIINQNVFILVGIGFAVHSVYLRFNTKDFEDNAVGIPFAVGFTVVTLFLRHQITDGSWDIYYKIVLISVIGLYFLIHYVEEYLRFLVVNESSTGIIPEKEIFRSGFGLAAAYTLFSIVILSSAASFTWLSKIADVIRNVLLEVLIFILGLFGSREDEVPSVPSEEEANSLENILIQENHEPSMFWKILEVIGIIALILGVCYGLYRGIKFLIAYIQRIMKNHAYIPDNLSDPSTVDVREKCGVGNKRVKPKEERNLFGLWDAATKIRKIYKKQVMLYKPNPLTASARKKTDLYNADKPGLYTAREMEERMDIPFAKIYEKARYSGEACSGQDVKNMKAMFNSKK